MTKKVKHKKPLQHHAGDVVHVNSYTYGKHVRAARGSKTPTTLNDIFATHAKKTVTINAAAKAIYDVLKLYSEGFREGQLWQAILSRMRKSTNTNFEELLHTLGDLELNNRYTLKRFGSLPVFNVENNKKELLVEIKTGMSPDLNKNDNSYQYELIVLLFNSKGICIQHDIQQTKWMYKKEKISNQAFNFQKPVHSKYYLLCLHLQGGRNSVSTDTLTSRGMVVVAVGKTEELKPR